MAMDARMISSQEAAPAAPKGGAITTERAAAVIVIGAIGFLALVRKGFGGVLHP
jgi:hypothetical protein